MEYSAGRTKLATVALVTVGFALGFAEFIVIGITPDIAEIYNIPLSDAGNLVGYFAVAYAVSTPIIVPMGRPGGMRSFINEVDTVMPRLSLRSSGI